MTGLRCDGRTDRLASAEEALRRVGHLPIECRKCRGHGFLAIAQLVGWTEAEFDAWAEGKTWKEEP